VLTPFLILLAELASDNYCEETTIGLIENTSVRLKEISAALKRIDSGTFGSCDKCGHEISGDRLQTVPFARQCIACDEKADPGEWHRREACSPTTVLQGT
jgi:DnaK suppressor protein